MGDPKDFTRAAAAMVKSSFDTIRASMHASYVYPYSVRAFAWARLLEESSMRALLWVSEDWAEASAVRCRYAEGNSTR
jgi:hypothetical protein